MKRPFAIAAPAVVLASCAAVGPDYVRPQMLLPAQFVHSGSAALTDASAERWWRGLGDPLLDELAARGLAQNLDIRTAQARIRQAEAALRRTGAPSQVRGDLTAQGGREGDRNGNADDVNSGAADAAFVLDLAGGARRGREGAAANLAAAGFDAGTTRLAYLADLADAYVDARYFQNAAWITRKAIESRRAALDLVTRQFGAGSATALDQEQARALLRSAEAELPTLQSGFEASVFRVATLLAEPAAPILDRMTRGAGQPAPKRGAATGTPADLLRNRPDVRAAEQDLAAATAAIGVAEAELYPSLTLSGSIGAGDDDDWSFGPTLRLPVLNRGVLTARRDEAVARASEAELAWRSAVLGAVEEVQAADSATRYWRRQVAAQRAAAEANDEVRDLTRKAYEGGETVLTDVLDAERRSLDNQLALSAGMRDLAKSWIQLQISTGRGWTDGTPPAAAAQE